MSFAQKREQSVQKDSAGVKGVHPTEAGTQSVTTADERAQITKKPAEDVQSAVVTKGITTTESEANMVENYIHQLDQAAKQINELIERAKKALVAGLKKLEDSNGVTQAVTFKCYYCYVNSETGRRECTEDHEKARRRSNGAVETCKYIDDGAVAPKYCFSYLNDTNGQLECMADCNKALELARGETIVRWTVTD